MTQPNRNTGTTIATIGSNTSGANVRPVTINVGYDRKSWKISTKIKPILHKTLVMQSHAVSEFKLEIKTKSRDQSHSPNDLVNRVKRTVGGYRRERCSKRE
jgi:hypothetical protein